MKARLILLLSLLWALPAASDIGAEKLSSSGICTTYRMCDAETTTGTCASTDEIVAVINRNRSHITLTSDNSTATAYSCDVTTNSQGHDANSGAGTVVMAGAVSNSQEFRFFQGSLDHTWMECTSITGGNVTIDLTACRASE